MFLSHIDRIEKNELKSETLRNVVKQRVIGAEEGWADHVLRVFTLGPEGYTPKHRHPWPHIVYVLEGRADLFHGSETSEIESGSVFYIPSELEHQFTNTGRGNLVFICIVPKEGDT